VLALPCDALALRELLVRRPGVVFDCLDRLSDRIQVLLELRAPLARLLLLLLDTVEPPLLLANLPLELPRRFLVLRDLRLLLVQDLLCVAEAEPRRLPVPFEIEQLLLLVLAFLVPRVVYVLDPLELGLGSSMSPALNLTENVAKPKFRKFMNSGCVPCDRFLKGQRLPRLD
jgi:hypothetical protein